MPKRAPTKPTSANQSKLMQTAGLLPLQLLASQRYMLQGFGLPVLCIMLVLQGLLIGHSIGMVKV